MGLLLLPQGLPVSVAQADTIAQADSVAQTDTAEPQIVCDRCDVTYPAEASSSGLSGIVGLIIDIDADGRVTNVLLTRSSGYRLLDQSAVETAATWQFRPIPEGAVGIPIQINYRVEDGALEEP
jgi:TonB family protein